MAPQCMSPPCVCPSMCMSPHRRAYIPPVCIFLWIIVPSRIGFLCVYFPSVLCLSVHVPFTCMYRHAYIPLVCTIFRVCPSVCMSLHICAPQYVFPLRVCVPSYDCSFTGMFSPCECPSRMSSPFVCPVSVLPVYVPPNVCRLHLYVPSVYSLCMSLRTYVSSDYMPRQCACPSVCMCWMSNPAGLFISLWSLVSLCACIYVPLPMSVTIASIHLTNVILVTYV